MHSPITQEELEALLFEESKDGVSPSWEVSLGDPNEKLPVALPQVGNVRKEENNEIS